MGRLLEHSQVLRLRGSGFALKLLSHISLDLRQLDICRLVAKYENLRGVLATHRSSIRSIGFHDIKFNGSMGEKVASCSQVWFALC